MATWNRDDSDLTIATGIGSTTIGSNLTLSANELDVASGNLTIDVAGGFILDTSTGSVDFKKDGNTFISIDETASGASVIYNDESKFLKIAASGVLNLTSENSYINLNTEDGNIDLLKGAGGNKFGRILESSGELVIQSGSTPTTALTFSGANSTFAGTVTAGYLSLDNMSFNNNVIACSGAALNLDSSSTIILDADDPNVIFKDAGVEWFRIKQDGTTRLKSNSAITIEANNYLYLNQGDDDKLKFTITDDFFIETLQGNLEFDSIGEITLDAHTDITLDANGGDIFLKDNGSTFGSLTNNSGNLIIKSGTTTALTFAGSNVTLAGSLQLGGNINIQPPSGDGSSEDFLVIDTGDDTVKKRSAAQVRTDLGIADSEIIDWTVDQGGTNIHAGNYDNTQLTTEEVQDIVGAMFSGNTETRISATYQDDDGTVDLVVDDMSNVTGDNGNAAIYDNSGTPAFKSGITKAEVLSLLNVADGAEVNVNADWNSSSGDSQISNKPTLVTALNGLSDVTYSSGDLTISGLDKIISGSLDFDSSGHINFDGCAAGFTRTTYADAADVEVDFTTGNKAHLDMTGGSISGTLTLKFPAISGNFVLVVQQDGSTRTINAYATKDAAGNAGNNDGGTAGAIRWAGGSAPDLTDGGNKRDVLSFYWDATEEVCYGVASLNF